MGIVRVTEADFELQVLSSEQPVLLDLYADWCEPCKKLLPVLEALSNEYAGKLKVAQVDVEANPMLARSFGVQSIPMLVLFAQGRPVDHVVGMVDRKRLEAMIAPFLPQSESAVEPAELAQLIVADQAQAVDIRDAVSYGRYRIPRAINIPEEQLPTRIEELIPADGRLRVLYSRTTEAAEEAAKKVAEAGVQVAFLTGGFLHWEADGNEVERG